jgi:hypothetical protein
MRLQRLVNFEVCLDFTTVTRLATPAPTGYGQLFGRGWYGKRKKSSLSKSKHADSRIWVRLSQAALN